MSGGNTYRQKLVKNFIYRRISHNVIDDVQNIAHHQAQNYKSYEK